MNDENVKLILAEIDNLRNDINKKYEDFKLAFSALDNILEELDYSNNLQRENKEAIKEILEKLK